MAMLTEFNHQVLARNPHTWVHYTIQATLLFWAVSALFVSVSLAQRLAIGPRADALVVGRSYLLDPASSGLLNRVESTLLVGYPLMIAASGLWFRVNMVWFTTGSGDRVLSVPLFLARRSTGASPSRPGWSRRPAIPQHLRGRPA